LFDRFVRKAGGFVRFGFVRFGRAATRRHTIDSFNIDEDPFDEEPQHARWLLTTCIVAAASTALVGGTLLGLFNGHRGTSSALASLQSFALLPGLTVPGKGSLGDVDDTAAALSPGKVIADQFVHQASAPAGGLAGQYPGISNDLLPYRAPTVVEGSFQMVALAPGDALSPGDTGMTIIAKTPPPDPVDETITLKGGQDLTDRLVELGVTKSAARALKAAIEPVFPTALIKPAQEFIVTLDKQPDFYGNAVIYPVRLSFSPGPKEEIVVEAELDGQFEARVQGGTEEGRSRYVSSPHYLAKGKIETSLYGTATEEGVPAYIIAEMMQVFAFDVDFQRQIHPGDGFEAFYGDPLSGSSTKRNVLHYATLDLSGKTKTYYRFTSPDDGVTAYYDETGQSANKFLMRTPVSGARMTSSYGLRKHPLLGYTRMHSGVDFGLPQGSPIKAAGSGTVTQAGRSGGYGITVRLKHQKGYETLYAHMSRIASGIKPGATVNQGQVIGYVGATGQATGPHLHYEIRVKGKPVNPMEVKAAGGRKLTGEMLEAFNAHKQKLVAMMKTAPASTQLAQID
jgi:murein DD-endopeptidase MepM/ murein hydrolase activator NlpD